MSNKKVRLIEKPWGHEELWAQTDSYLGKFLFIKKGHRLSLQYHLSKEETIYVMEGILNLDIGIDAKGSELQTKRLLVGDSCHIAPGTIHRFCATETDVVLAEVSTGEIMDVVRIADDYSRH
jgi:mannose-6-phosphate isomerase